MSFECYGLGTKVSLSGSGERSTVRLLEPLMLFSVLIVFAAFGLLYVLVTAEERRMQEVAKSRRP